MYKQHKEGLFIIIQFQSLDYRKQSSLYPQRIIIWVKAVSVEENNEFQTQLILYKNLKMQTPDKQDTKLSIQTRDGPIKERKCTDFFCCILYLLLLGTVIFFGVFASSAIKMSQAQMQKQLQNTKQAKPLLAVSHSVIYIIISVASVVALSFVLVIISFIIPSISTYIIIPLILLLMLLIGSGFIYRYFGNKLPFVGSQLQQTYATPHSFISLIVGIAFILGFVVSIIVIFLKQQRMKFIVASLSLAKICFWQNFYMIFISFGLSVVSIAALYGNVKLLEISQLQVDGQQKIDKHIFTILVLVQMLWTHGYLQSYSDFLFQSIAIHWYYNSKNPGVDYSSFGSNLCPSLGLSFKHIGTISFGWILAYIPESFNVLMHQLQEKADGCYRYLCCCHRWCCEDLSKYCYIGTIMYSQSFCKASKTVKQTRLTAKHTFPELYMIGNFYITLIKIFTILVGLIICYFLVAQHPDKYTSSLNLLAPLVVTLLGSLEIANHFMNSTGLVGDTIYLTYVIDYNCESSNFGNLNAEHCPPQAYEVIRDARISKYDALHD